MNLIPVVILLIVEAAHAVDSHAAADRRCCESLWIDDLADNERPGLMNVIDKLECQIAVIIIISYFGNVSLSDNVRFGVVFYSRDAHSMVVSQLDCVCH